MSSKVDAVEAISSVLSDTARKALCISGITSIGSSSLCVLSVAMSPPSEDFGERSGFGTD